VVLTNCIFPAMLDDVGMRGAMPVHMRQRLIENHEAHTAIRAAHRLGVRIAMGTDAGTPGNHHGQNTRECADGDGSRHEAAGEPHCATMNPAKLLRQESNLGSLDVGKFADIAGCRGNPLADIAEVTRVAFVMKGGTIYWDELTRQRLGAPLARSRCRPLGSTAPMGMQDLGRDTDERRILRQPGRGLPDDRPVAPLSRRGAVEWRLDRLDQAAARHRAE
jgi:hypothetical protein